MSVVPILSRLQVCDHLLYQLARKCLSPVRFCSQASNELVEELVSATHLASRSAVGYRPEPCTDVNEADSLGSDNARKRRRHSPLATPIACYTCSATFRRVGRILDPFRKYATHGEVSLVKGLNHMPLTGTGTGHIKGDSFQSPVSGSGHS